MKDLYDPHPHSWQARMHLYNGHPVAGILLRSRQSLRSSASSGRATPPSKITCW